MLVKIQITCLNFSAGLVLLSGELFVSFDEAEFPCAACTMRVSSTSCFGNKAGVVNDLFV
jgi:hypothetical protein